MTGVNLVRGFESLPLRWLSRATDRFVELGRADRLDGMTVEQALQLAADDDGGFELSEKTIRCAGTPQHVCGQCPWSGPVALASL